MILGACEDALLRCVIPQNEWSIAYLWWLLRVLSQLVEVLLILLEISCLILLYTHRLSTLRQREMTKAFENFHWSEVIFEICDMIFVIYCGAYGAIVLSRNVQCIRIEWVFKLVGFRDWWCDVLLYGLVILWWLLLQRSEIIVRRWALNSVDRFICNGEFLVMGLRPLVV